MELIICKKCGFRNINNGKICFKCKTNLTEVIEDKIDKSELPKFTFIKIGK